MSVISSIFDLFRLANAIPSVEASAGHGLGYNRIVENLRARLPVDTVISPNVLGQALSRIQRGLSIGADITAGRTIDPRLYPIDPTLPGETNYRYRVAVEISIPPERGGGREQSIRTVIPIDSFGPLTLQQIQEIIEGEVRDLGMRETIPGGGGADILLSVSSSSVRAVQIISAYRKALR